MIFALFAFISSNLFPFICCKLGDVRNNDSEHLHRESAIANSILETEAHTPCTSLEKGDSQQQVSQAQQSRENGRLVCKCNLPAAEYRPLFGPNSGKKMLKCPKKLPEIPCDFSTIKNTENVNSGVGIFLEKSVDINSTQSKGIVKTPLCALSVNVRKSLKLPTALKVKGQPKMGVQRTFKKTNKSWTIPKGDFISDRDKRRTKGNDISDTDVSYFGNQSWQVKSQKSATTYDIEKAEDTSTTCFCDNQSSCVHCFSCQCPDYKIRLAICKHIYKVQQLYMKSLPEELGTDDADMNINEDDANAEKSDEEEQDNQSLVDLVDALDVLSGSAQNERMCEICKEQGKPTQQSAHKCAKCFQPIHLFGCSTLNPDPEAKEGYGGTDRICWKCYDILAVKFDKISNNPSSNPHDDMTQQHVEDHHEDKIYYCFSCQAQRVRRVSTVRDTPGKKGTYGRAFYICTNPINDKCRRFFWGPVKATKKYVSPSKEKNSGGSVASKGIQNYFLLESKCIVCNTTLTLSDKKVNCSMCSKEVHHDNCSFDHITSSDSEPERVCKSCSCLKCRTIHPKGHRCLCCVCNSEVNESVDHICYRCKRLTHDRCSNQIQAHEIDNKLQDICKHCFDAMATGVSISIRSDILGKKMLSDEHMARASAILSAQFASTTDGLCAPLAVTFGNKVDNSNYYPERNPFLDYVQIMNTGRKHWVTAIFKSGLEDVTVLDSCRNLPLSGHTKIQLAMIAKHKGDFEVIRVPCKQQHNSYDCGVFAIAFAVEYCFHNCVDYVDFDPSSMRNHLLTCLEAGVFTEFPRLKSSRQKKIRQDPISETVEVSCICRLPSTFDAQMVVCDKCSNWFHESCLGIEPEELMPDQAWFCSECQK